VGALECREDFLIRGEGIFTQNNLLVATGDAISGKTLNGFGTIVSLNDAGRIKQWLSGAILLAEGRWQILGLPG
jgi:hypothetical protein